MIMGYNGSGKTTLAQEFVNNGYYRVNRDEIGGKLKDLHLHLEKVLERGCTKIVTDNTFRDVVARKPIIDVAKKWNIPIRCIHLSTSLEESQYNACQRMIRKYGKLLSPEEMKKSKDPNSFPPAALFGYRNAFQAPSLEEGFENIETKPFIREFSDNKQKALILDYDGTLRKSTGKYDFPISPKEVEILPNRKNMLQNYIDNGYLLLGVSNQSGIAKGIAKEQDVVDCFKKTNELLGFDIDYRYCPHSIPPVKCYCRKPHVGLGVLLIERYKLNPEHCLMVGDQTTDKTFASRCGFQYSHPEDFFQCTIS